MAEIVCAGNRVYRVGCVWDLARPHEAMLDTRTHARTQIRTHIPTHVPQTTDDTVRDFELGDFF